MQLGHEERVRRGVAQGELLEARRVGSPDEVVGKVEEIDGDPRFEQRIADLRKDLVELGPGEVEGLEILQTAGAEHAALEALAAARKARKEALRVRARKRRQGLLPQRAHRVCITP